MIIYARPDGLYGNLEYFVPPRSYVEKNSKGELVNFKATYLKSYPM